MTDHLQRLAKLFTPQQLEAMAAAEERRQATIAAIAANKAKQKAAEAVYQQALRPILDQLHEIQRRCPHEWGTRNSYPRCDCEPSMGGCSCGEYRVCSICGET